MSPVQTQTDNPHRSTGPKTDRGKATSANNAQKTGLFSNRNYVAPGEENEYNDLRRSLLRQLRPDSALQQIHAGEIIAASWRLRRCGILETEIPDLASDAQKSIDRARAGAQNAIRRATAELRKIQTEQQIRLMTGFDKVEGLTDMHVALKAALLQTKIPDPQSPVEETPDEDDDRFAYDHRAVMDRTIMLARLGRTPAPVAAATPDTSFCKTAASPNSAPQNSDSSFCKTPVGLAPETPCPCQSGVAFASCCGAVCIPGGHYPRT
jgi:hypothetical protein